MGQNDPADQERTHMFNNKREIFSFRKYKAYGLASAVIAAFSCGVAHADEVTATTNPQLWHSNS